MPHGIYIAEFEHELSRRGYAISQQSLADLVAKVDLSKLAAYPESDRVGFYAALVDSILPMSRGIEDGLQILGENDAAQIVSTMAANAAGHAFASSRVRDIWCKIFIGGCP